jgi:hypothetical protein
VYVLAAGDCLYDSSASAFCLLLMFLSFFKSSLAKPFQFKAATIIKDQFSLLGSRSYGFLDKASAITFALPEQCSIRKANCWRNKVHRVKRLFRSRQLRKKVRALQSVLIVNLLPTSQCRYFSNAHTIAKASNLVA